MTSKAHGMHFNRLFALSAVVVATLCLVGGILWNRFVWNAPLPSSGLDPGLYVLIAMYATLHAVALVIARFVAVLSSWVGLSKNLPLIYTTLTIFGVAVSFVVLNPKQYGGIHLFTIMWISLFAISLVFMAMKKQYLSANYDGR